MTQTQSHPYHGQFYPFKPYDFRAISVEKAEEVAAWLFRHNTSWVARDDNAPKVPYISYKGETPWQREQHELETIHRDAFLAAFPDLPGGVNYDQYEIGTGARRDATEWATDVNTVMSSWECQAYALRLLDMIQRADIPETFRAFLLAFRAKGGNISVNSASSGFPVCSVTPNGRDQKAVDARHYCYSQEAWGDRNSYAVIDADGKVTSFDTWYSIGD